MKIYLKTLLLILISSSAWAQFDYGFDFSKSGTAGLQFLKIGVGARHTGMGEATSSITDDASSLFWNPAGITHMQQQGFFAAYSTWLVESKHAALAYVMPFEGFHVGLSVVSLQIEPFEERTVAQSNGTGRMVEAGDMMIGLTFAKAFTEKLSIGGTVKFVQEKLDDETFNNVLVDVGTFYFTGWRDLRLAFTLQHFGPDKAFITEKFKMPLLFRVGIADYIYKSDTFSALLAADLVHPTDNVEWVNLGVETVFFNQFFVRSGYRFNRDVGDISFGFGVKTPHIFGVASQIDYGYSAFGDVFGDVHRFSFEMAF